MSSTEVTPSRVYLNITTGEFDVSGGESFVQNFTADIRHVLELLGTAQKSRVVDTEDVVLDLQGDDLHKSTSGMLFGEALHAVADGSGTDQILLAGWFASKAKFDNTFTTGEANALLIEQGVKISNPSQSLKNNISAKRVFKQGDRYKISRVGIEYLSKIEGLEL